MIRLRRLQPTTRRPHDSGASAVEYALLIAAIGAVIIGVVFALGGKVRSAIDTTSTCLAANSASCTAAPAVSTPTATTPAPAPSTAAPTPAPSSSSTRGSGNNGNGNGNGWGYGHGNNND